MTYQNKDNLPLCKECGVYRITNSVNSKVYVGSANQIRARLHAHRSNLRLGRHDNEILQRSWNKHGEDKFLFDVIETCTKNVRIAREQFWMDTLEVTDRNKGYNINPVAGGGGMEGRKHSEETRAKFRANMVGKDISALTKAAAEANRGRKRTPESVAKSRAGLTGQKRSEETKAKVKANHWSKRSDAKKIAAKIVANRPQELTEEHRAKIGANHWKNRPDAEEVKARVAAAVSKAQKGRTYSAEVLANMAAGQQRRREKAKEQQARVYPLSPLPASVID